MAEYTAYDDVKVIYTDKTTSDTKTVVRCKDCRYNSGGYCHLDKGYGKYRGDPDGFCKWGERE